MFVLFFIKNRTSHHTNSDMFFVKSCASYCRLVNFAIFVCVVPRLCPLRPYSSNSRNSLDSALNSFPNSHIIMAISNPNRFCDRLRQHSSAVSLTVSSFRFMLLSTSPLVTSKISCWWLGHKIIDLH